MRETLLEAGHMLFVYVWYMYVCSRACEKCNVGEIERGKEKEKEKASELPNYGCL